MNPEYEEILQEIAELPAGAEWPQSLRDRVRDHIQRNPESGVHLVALADMAEAIQEPVTPPAGSKERVLARVQEALAADEASAQDSAEHLTTPAIDHPSNDEQNGRFRMPRQSVLRLAALIAIVTGITIGLIAVLGGGLQVPSVTPVTLRHDANEQKKDFRWQWPTVPSQSLVGLEPTKTENRYLAVLQGSLKPQVIRLDEFAKQGWELAVAGRESVTMLVLDKPSSQSEDEFVSMVGGELEGLSDKLALDTGYRLAWNGDDVWAERTGGVPRSADPVKDVDLPAWATQLSRRLSSKGIHCTGWTFSIGE